MSASPALTSIHNQLFSLGAMCMFVCVYLCSVSHCSIGPSRALVSHDRARCTAENIHTHTQKVPIKCTQQFPTHLHSPHQCPINCLLALQTIIITLPMAILMRQNKVLLDCGSIVSVTASIVSAHEMHKSMIGIVGRCFN